MTYLLSGDIGGTKTLLQMSAADEYVPLLQKSYASADFSGLAEMLDGFIAETGVHNIAAACFALAGPVHGRVVKLTNLPWQVDADELAKRYGISHVTLINDFEAMGHGIAALRAADLLTLQAGAEQAEGARLVLGAGTGLGVAWLSVQQGAYQVHPSEGGHIDFAPVDETQTLLLRYLQQRHGHVSYERIVSGPGLIAIYEFIRESGRASPSAQLLAALEDDDAAAVITRFSQKEDEPVARLAVDLFLSIYGAFAGNMALASLPRGGIYVAGGIAAKIAAQMQRGEFMDALLSKGRFRELLATFPVHIVLNRNTGLMGANLIAQRQEKIIS
jgi:glucokinase